MRDREIEREGHREIEIEGKIASDHMFKTRILRRNVWNSSLGSAKSHTNILTHTRTHIKHILGV